MVSRTKSMSLAREIARTRGGSIGVSRVGQEIEYGVGDAPSLIRAGFVVDDSRSGDGAPETGYSASVLKAKRDGVVLDRRGGVYPVQKNEHVVAWVSQESNGKRYVFYGSRVPLSGEHVVELDESLFEVAFSAPQGESAL